jgi:hypothetical protein
LYIDILRRLKRPHKRLCFEEMVQIEYPLRHQDQVNDVIQDGSDWLRATVCKDQTYSGKAQEMEFALLLELDSP